MTPAEADSLSQVPDFKILRQEGVCLLATNAAAKSKQSPRLRARGLGAPWRIFPFNEAL